MSIQSEITRLSGNVSDALGAISAKGVTIPSGSNSDDLATLIGQIQQGGGGAGLVYESGTYTPSEDIQNPQITFNSTHTTLPIFAMISDESDENFPLSSYIGCSYTCWYSYTGVSPFNVCGFASRRFLSGTGSASGAGVVLKDTNISSYVSTSQYNPTGGGTGYYFRAGRTYKWIAVWGPTT